MDWPLLYAGNDSEHDRYVGASDFASVLEPLVGEEDEILHVGCGSSALGEELYKRKRKFITNVDTCRDLIDTLAKRYLKCTEMQFVCMDACKLPTELSEAFGLVCDKAFLDALLADGEGELHKAYLRDAKRVLKQGGWFCCLSHGVPDKRVKVLAEGFGVHRNKVRVMTMAKPVVPGLNNGASADYFVYSIRKE